MFSMSSGLPYDIHSSRIGRNILSDSCVDFRPFAASRELIHLWACPCGSISSGQREERVTRMPFWMERPSDGRPSSDH